MLSKTCAEIIGILTGNTPPRIDPALMHSSIRWSHFLVSPGVTYHFKREIILFYKRQKTNKKTLQNIFSTFKKYVLEDISLHRIFFLFFFNELPLQVMEMSEKPCTKQFHIYNFTNFCLTLDQLSPNVNLCHSHLGRGLLPCRFLFQSPLESWFHWPGYGLSILPT